MKSPYHFQVYEQGNHQLPIVLFLHGFMGCADDWKEIISSLSDNFHCIAIDLPGHGKTTVTGGDDSFRMDRVADGIVTLFKSMNITTCNLVAYSMGGRLGLYLSVHYPHLFHKIILESTSPGLKTKTERHNRCKHDKAIAERMMQIPLRQFLDEWYDQPLFSTMKQYPDKLKQLKQSRLHNNIEGLVKSLLLMGTGNQPSLWEKLLVITAHPLLIVGAEDTKFRVIAKEMQAGIIQTEIVEVPQAGHAAHWEQPEIFAKLVKEFLSS